MKLTIARRIGLVATIPAVIMVVLVTTAWLSISALSTIQDEGMTLVRQASAAQDLVGIGPRLYRVIADSEINHDLAASAKEWQEAVERERKAIDAFAKDVDTAQKRTAFEAGKNALEALIRTYEAEMLPALRKQDDITPTIRDLDGKIDGFVKDLGDQFGTVTSLAASASQARDDLFDTKAHFFSLMVAVTGGLGFGLALMASFFIARSIIRPMATLQGNMEAMASGNYALAIVGVDRRDELGAMARTVETFRSGLAEAEVSRQQREQAEAGERAHLEARTAIADRFATRMERIGQDVFRSSSEVAEAARSLLETAEDTRRQAQAVLGSAEEASANVQTVAASTEEMSSSISEIANQVARSNSVANSAAAEAARTEADVKALSEAAMKIGEVVELISNIAGQTNLLALNATIEAARAGESGRGFAVVASEVKQLAAQTGRATEEIGAKIAEIQAATNRTVTSIDRIVGTVGQIQQISTLIAAAIEEQGAATGEISSNTHLAARGTQNVTNTIDTVGRAAEMTGSAATQLTGLSGNLNVQATDLQREVSAFVQQLRAG